MKVVNPNTHRTPKLSRLTMTSHYKIRHHTRFLYSSPIMESFMEVRMSPLSDTWQSCHSFSFSTNPKSEPMQYQDYMGNCVHHFNIPALHGQLDIKTEVVVEKRPFDPLPSSLTSRTWDELDSLRRNGFYWDYINPSSYTKSSEKLDAFAKEIGLDRRMDPLTLLRWLNSVIYEKFTYLPNTTKVDSPIDEALENRLGVCQDFSHIMIALVRRLGIPCRYVSGYLYHRPEEDRSAEDATHSWIEALLPTLGWIGFDPTNNLTADDRHIRVATGRDYADVPPTRGVFRGEVDAELEVGVKVTRLDDMNQNSSPLLTNISWEPTTVDDIGKFFQQQQQQQQ